MEPRHTTGIQSRTSIADLPLQHTRTALPASMNEGARDTGSLKRPPVVSPRFHNEKASGGQQRAGPGLGSGVRGARNDSFPKLWETPSFDQPRNSVPATAEAR